VFTRAWNSHFRQTHFYLAQQLGTVYVKHGTTLPHLPPIEKGSVRMEPFRCCPALGGPLGWEHNAARDECCRLNVGRFVHVTLKDRNTFHFDACDCQPFNISSCFAVADAFVQKLLQIYPHEETAGKSHTIAEAQCRII
jgi:hypothetical protein